ncbi:MAG: DUF1905 domain-containing protein [Actinobacteria bacterium]|nr:DUF1905 domain-containing protein [Actinomycetota bacterium]
MTIALSFTAEITKDKNSGWTCVEWPESVRVLGTGKSVKMIAAIDGHEFQATFLPIGGMHMLPLRAAILKAIKKQVGDTVEVYLRDRL